MHIHVLLVSVLILHLQAIRDDHFAYLDAACLNESSFASRCKFRVQGLRMARTCCISESLVRCA